MSRLELGLIATALLVPVPLVALNGYAAALPGSVGHGLGSLVTLEAGSDHSGLEARGQAGESGTSTRRSGTAALAITRSRRASSSAKKSAPPRSGEGGAATGSSDDTAAAPQSDRPGENGDSGDSGSAGGRGDASSTDEGSAARSGSPQGLSLTVGGGGTAAGVTAGSDGATVQIGADSGGARDGDAATASADVTDDEGSSSGVGITVPDTGSALP